MQICVKKVRVETGQNFELIESFATNKHTGIKLVPVIYSK